MSVHPLLTGAAYVVCGPAQCERLACAADQVSDWDPVIDQAEIHGVAPLLYTNLRAAGVTLPRGVARRLQPLVIRHRHANEVRMRLLREILDACSGRGIQVVVLKGAALCNILYVDIALRPMSDLDILVPRRDAWAVQQILTELGFTAPSAAPSRFMSHHHHLPVASIRREGLGMNVEVHHNALNPDCPVSLTLDELSDQPRVYQVEGKPAVALGHHDMLRQLSYHATSPADVMRLIWIADIVGYAARFADEIDWARLRRADPFVINVLALFHYVTPLPEVLAQHVPPPAAAVPGGVVIAMKPLSRILRRGHGFRAIVNDLFYPSDWWLHLYYGIRANRSLWWCRWTRHPARILRWLLQRVWAYAD